MLKGKGELILTGRLGEVMKESSSAAFSYTKLKLFELELDTEELKNYDIHLHIPEGAVPKEGPSAGVTLAVSLISLLTGIPVRSDYAMTGEITLRGKILPVGGIKEKIIAAHRYGIKNILIPSENEKDFREDIPEELKSDIRIHPGRHHGRAPGYRPRESHQDKEHQEQGHPAAARGEPAVSGRFQPHEHKKIRTCRDFLQSRASCPATPGPRSCSSAAPTWANHR